MSTARGNIVGQHVSGEGSLFDVPPAAIGRFRVLHQVGAGASGPVFRAVHPETDAALAIKLFTLPFAPERVQAIAEELESLVRRIPVVEGACQLVDAGVHGSIPFLVTSFAAGDSLDVALKQFGPAALVDLTPRLRTLARALDAAAELDVMHGALHPRDVLVSETGTAMTGLGAWPVLMRNGERLPIRRPYRAPELADTTVSAAGDRFALAALSYEWMTGRRAPSAFVAADMAPIPGADRDALGGIFARALHADPDHRYPSCEAFVADIADLEGEEASVPTAEAPRPETRSRRRAGRAEKGPTLLPLETFPAESDTPRMEDGELRIRPASGSDFAETAAIAPRLMVPPAASRHGDARVSPAAGASWRAGPVALSPTSSLLRDAAVPSPPVRASSGGGALRLVLGLVLGAALGVGAGYAVWGRYQSTSTPLTESATNAPAEAAEPSPPSPSAVPAGTANAPASASPDAPAPAPSEPPPTSTSPPPVPSTAPRPAPAPVPTGNLLVRSTPAGATVFVDDERRGVTPLALQNVELGTRRVRVQRDGFAAEDRQITLTRSRPSRSVDVRLSRAAPVARATPPPAPTSAARTGSLVIESRPTGATIVLNGRQVGTTPMTIDDLEPGTYSVQLQLATFRSITTTVRVVAGTRARAAASLTSVQEPR